MRQYGQKAEAWVYRGAWKVLSEWFRVPEEPPTLPVREGDFIHSFHPSRSYLSYLKLRFLIVALLVNAAAGALGIALFVANTEAALWMLLPMLMFLGVFNMIGYISLFLRYDTMWYVMTDQSLRCRRGIWIILEHTITFENVQNVSIRRGPLQYLFGISTIVVETAGSSDSGQENAHAVGNQAILEGIDNPKEIRDLIMDRVRESKSSGLGDERTLDVPQTMFWDKQSLTALSEIRDEVRGLLR